jgi:hypothetical protein
LGKTRRGAKEYSREQQLIHENKQLKRELSRLQKQLARIDLDRYSHIQDMLKECKTAEESTQDTLDKLKQEWKCNKCQDGYLEIFTYTKMGEVWYIRKCNCCNNKTKSQIYTPNVKGILINKPEIEEKE